MQKKSVNIWTKQYSEKIFEDTEITHLKITGVDLQIEGRVDLQFFKSVLKDDTAIKKLIKIYPEYFELAQEVTIILAKINNHNYPKKIGFPELADEETIEGLEKEVALKMPLIIKYKNFLSEIIINFENKLLKIGYPCFRYGSLKKLSPKISQLKNLEELDLSYNCLNNLPEEIAELKHLKSINLSYNCFTDIPKVLLKFKNIRYINMKENPLKGIPPEFESLKIQLENEKNSIVSEKKKFAKIQAFRMAKQMRELEKKTGFFISSKHFFNYLPLLAELLYEAN